MTGNIESSEIRGTYEMQMLQVEIVTIKMVNIKIVVGYYAFLQTLVLLLRYLSLCKRMAATPC